MSGTEVRIPGRWRAAAGIALAAVVVLSLGPRVSPWSGFIDRIGHAAAYALLTILVLLAHARVGAGGRGRLSRMVLALGLATFGVAMEFGQAMVHRDAAVWDGLADALGVAIGLGAHSLLRAIHDRRRASTIPSPPRLGFSSPPTRPRS
jgi:VanZ family protein